MPTAAQKQAREELQREAYFHGRIGAYGFGSASLAPLVARTGSVRVARRLYDLEYQSGQTSPLRNPPGKEGGSEPDLYGLLPEQAERTRRYENQIVPVYEVRADSETGEWLNDPTPTGQAVRLRDWNAQHDSRRRHFDTYQHHAGEDDEETRAIIVRWESGAAPDESQAVDNPAGYRVHVGYTARGRDRWRYFATLAEASAFAGTIFTKTGVVVAVESAE
jgi:hypothetical protein